MKIILASASERRTELLKRIVDEFSVIVSNFDEDSVPFKGNFGDYVIELSKGKALSVAQRVKEEALIIACDTIVAVESAVLGKPSSKEEAILMLERLSGRTHQVYSGLTVMNTKTLEIKCDYVKTDVKFSMLTKGEIRKYVESGEPMDKAGAYGIQGGGGVFVEEINGCYYNVVGLPLNRLNHILRGMGVNL
ncbi:Maf-like protein [Clostridium thermarum]|uniref:Maf-like protein n=1 Tax=Clostridium thermarum TaxID=1716543 RepID=UPI00112318FA|nr:Maf-like protein [Clostridium thermarum]